MAARYPSHAILPALVAILLSPSCERQTADERQEEQRVLRAERLARARARRAERARRQRLRGQLSMNPRQRPARPAAPAGPCVPKTELKRRATSAAFNDRFTRAVHLVLDAIRSDLVTLSKTTYQRFTFTVRMHPGDAPRFGRRASKALALTLRWRPLCGGPGSAASKPETLHVQLVRLRKGKRPPGSFTSLWPHKPGDRTHRVPVGVPIQLLLEPGRPTLAKGRGGPGSLGLWEIRQAQFEHRPRYQRLSLASSALPASLRQLHAVEVGCDRRPDKRCRFLTRQQGRRALVTPWKKLLKLAAPIKDRARVLQLHAIDLQLHFPKCGGDPRRPNEAQRQHPCLRNGMVSMACLFWRATAGFGNAPVVSGEDPFTVRHVLRCPGKKLRVLQLNTVYGRQGRHRRKVTDLSPRTSRLLHQVRRLTSPGRRRR